MFYLLLFLFHLHCAFVGGGLARQLGRDPAPWTVGCLLTGTLGIALLWFLGRSVEVTFGCDAHSWKKWLTLAAVDPDIGEVHETVKKSCGERAAMELAERFSYVDDKAALPALVDLVRYRYDRKFRHDASQSSSGAGEANAG